LTLVDEAILLASVVTFARRSLMMRAPLGLRDRARGLTTGHFGSRHGAARRHSTSGRPVPRETVSACCAS
jgi:hypothetical protein